MNLTCIEKKKKTKTFILQIGFLAFYDGALRFPDTRHLFMEKRSLPGMAGHLRGLEHSQGLWPVTHEPHLTLCLQRRRQQSLYFTHKTFLDQMKGLRMVTGRMLFPCEARSLSLVCCGCWEGCTIQDEEGKWDTSVIPRGQEENWSSPAPKIILMPVNKCLKCL